MAAGERALNPPLPPQAPSRRRPDPKNDSPLRKYHPGEPPVVTDHQPATESPLFGKRSVAPAEEHNEGDRLDDALVQHSRRGCRVGHGQHLE